MSLSGFLAPAPAYGCPPPSEQQPGTPKTGGEGRASSYGSSYGWAPSPGVPGGGLKGCGPWSPPLQDAGRWAAISQARDVLLDPQLRRAFDAERLQRLLQLMTPAGPPRPPPFTAPRCVLLCYIVVCCRVLCCFCAVL